METKDFPTSLPTDPIKTKIDDQLKEIEDLKKKLQIAVEKNTMLEEDLFKKILELTELKNNQEEERKLKCGRINIRRKTEIIKKIGRCQWCGDTSLMCYDNMCEKCMCKG